MRRSGGDGLKFIVLAEGHTEQRVLPDFLAKWFLTRFTATAEFDIICLEGCSNFKKKAHKRAKDYLEKPEIIGVIGLLDLHGPDFYASNCTTIDEKYAWAVEYFEGLVKDARFRMFLAVHEIEAWLFSQPDVFPESVRMAVQNQAEPETIDFEKPPSRLLNEFYDETLRRDYKKVTDGALLFDKLDPSIAYGKCPYLRKLLDGIASLAINFGFVSR